VAARPGLVDSGHRHRWALRAGLALSREPAAADSPAARHHAGELALGCGAPAAGSAAPKQELKQTAGELSELVRRIAIARLGRESCAGLTGEDWLDWLGGHDPKGFDWTRRGRVLLSAPYAPPAKADRPEELLALIDAAYDWVATEDKKHV
jgi:hypothetical protein